MRVISNNAADRATLQTTSATLTGMGVANLQSDLKSKFCRTTSGANGVLTVTATWATAETIAAVVLGFTNSSAGTTMRVQAYTNVADATPVADVTKTVVTSVLGNHYGSNSENYVHYSGGLYASLWLPTRVAVKKVVITLTSPGNTTMQAGKLIIGDYWQPMVVEAQGTNTTVVDMSEQFRSDSGDMHVNVMPQYRKQSISLPALDATDATKLWGILWGNGRVKPVYISMFPDNSDNTLDQTNQLFGRLASNPVMNTPFWNYRSATLEVEEV